MIKLKIRNISQYIYISMPEDRKKKEENVLSFIFPLKQISNTFNYYFQ